MRRARLPLSGANPKTKLYWRPIKEEDKNNLSTKYCNEVEHGIVSPEYAAEVLGYPPEARQGTLFMKLTNMTALLIAPLLLSITPLIKLV